MSAVWATVRHLHRIDLEVAYQESSTERVEKWKPPAAGDGSLNPSQSTFHSLLGRDFAQPSWSRGCESFQQQWSAGVPFLADRRELDSVPGLEGTGLKEGESQVPALLVRRKTRVFEWGKTWYAISKGRGLQEMSQGPLPRITRPYLFPFDPVGSRFPGAFGQKKKKMDATKIL